MLRKIWITVILALFLVSTIGLAQDKEIMSLSEIEPGMKGKGYSVFKGTRIAEFDVEIVGTIGAGKEKFIMAMLSGIAEGMDLPFEKTGVIAGMSGSPVYIDGRLIGAISFLPNAFALQPLAGITPIESMLNIGIDALDCGQLSTIPFLVSTRPEIVQRLFKKQGLDLLILPLGTMSPDTAQITDNETELKPGSSITVFFMKGDVLDLAGTGTLTYIDGKKVYAFGHPLLGAGSTSFPFYLSRVLTIASSQWVSTKMIEACIGPPLGTITKDYSTGTAGVLGKKAESIPLKISFKHKNNKVEFREEIFRCSYDLLLMYITIDYACETFFVNNFFQPDQNNDISIRIQLEAIVKGAKRKIQATRYSTVPTYAFFSDFSSDINQFLQQFYYHLLASHFSVEFEQINFDIEVLKGKKTYSADKVFLTKEGELIAESTVEAGASGAQSKISVHPGEAIELSIILRNADTLKKILGKLTIPIPEDANKGQAKILINDANSYRPKDPFEKKMVRDSLNYPKNLEELIAAINKKLDEKKLHVQIIYPQPKKQEQADVEEESDPMTEPSEEPIWQGWKKLEEAGKFPEFKDSKHSQFIKQIIIPIELEGIVSINEELHFKIEPAKKETAEKTSWHLGLIPILIFLLVVVIFIGVRIWRIIKNLD